MPNPTIIVGAGLAGLACAVRLREAEREVLVLEASDGIGGRVRTDALDGFLLDLDALDLQRFRSGALVMHDGRLRRMMDGLRHPERAIGTALQPIGTLTDKLRVLRLRHRALHGPALEKDQCTESFLREFGFSKRMADS